MEYRVVFAYDDDVWQTRIVNAESEQAVAAWFRMYEPDTSILGIYNPIALSVEPDEPAIDVARDYSRHMDAADGMSLILFREKSMTCEFYVMDTEGLKELEKHPGIVDSRGNPLMIGDWYVIITCANEHRYYVNVTYDSVTAMCAEVFGFIQHK